MITKGAAISAEMLNIMHTELELHRPWTVFHPAYVLILPRTWGMQPSPWIVSQNITLWKSYWKIKIRSCLRMWTLPKRRWVAKGIVSTGSGALHKGSTRLGTWPRTALAHCWPFNRHLSYPVAQDKNPGLLFSSPPTSVHQLASVHSFPSLCCPAITDYCSSPPTSFDPCPTISSPPA